MDGMTLLARARAAGLEVRAVRGRLLIRGPRRHEALARELLANKAAVLQALHDERPPYWPMEIEQRDWGWVGIKDPFKGIWHEIRWRDAPEWVRRRVLEG